MRELMSCPLCGKFPEVVDDRLGFFVRCKNHAKPWPVVYGCSHREIDHIESDEEAEAAVNAIDWDAVEKLAVDAWNAWAKEKAND